MLNRTGKKTKTKNEGKTAHFMSYNFNDHFSLMRTREMEYAVIVVTK